MTAQGGTLTAPAPVDLTSGAAWFIAKAVKDLGRAADILRQSGGLIAPTAMALAECDLYYDPAGPAIYRTEPGGLKVSVTLRDGRAELAITERAA